MQKVYHHKATISSTFMFCNIFFPASLFLIISYIFGVLIEPPTNITSSISSCFNFAKEIASFTFSRHKSHKSLNKSSYSFLVIFILKSFPLYKASMKHEVFSNLDNSILTFSIVSLSFLRAIRFALFSLSSKLSLLKSGFF